eukprot:TRINITY_DN58697_c0_g1_i1.p2 TRINITY_DN58697_c0_g1~~TRINITY_DN58697_c0_g1_i1.p2  ORF type:complete len:171 (+),score=52.38 TRINITY_DN58697_c0_g1_i1:58-513(+)
MAAFLRRRQRVAARKLKSVKGSWTSDTLGLLVEDCDCAFVTEPFSWIVDSLVAFLDEPLVRMSPRAAAVGCSASWITEAFSTVVQSTQLQRHREGVNWISTAFASLAGQVDFASLAGVQNRGIPQDVDEAHGAAWMQEALRAAAGSEGVEA